MVQILILFLCNSIAFFLLGYWFRDGPAFFIRLLRARIHAWWRRISRGAGGRPHLSREIVELIARLSMENPLWGAPRIHGELLKLGYRVSQSSVSRYMLCRKGRPTQNWKTFLDNHKDEIAAIDMFTVATPRHEWLYAFVVLGLARRAILHIEVTIHPTARWLAQQITEAFPWDTSVPIFMVRDNDRAYGRIFRKRLYAMGIRDWPITPHSPWQNGYVERLIGSIRRECLDHIVIESRDHLHRVLKTYADYYNNDRTHLSLEKDSPQTRAVDANGEIVSYPVLGGLHHRYARILPN